MTSKTKFFGAAAAAIALSAATISAAPAQALSITQNSVLSFGGSAKLLPNKANPTQLTFVGGKTTIGESEVGSFAGLTDTTALIKNLTLTSVGSGFFKSGSVADFIKGIGPNAISFDLASFIYNKNDGSAKFSGLFRSGTDSLAANGGLFTSQLFKTNPTTYSASIAAIPTPALLPGLIGLGMGVLRKRKKEMAEANAEA